MGTQDLATGGDQPETITAPAAAAEPQKVDDTTDEGNTSQAGAVKGDQPEPAKDPAKEDQAASEAAKALQKRKQTMQERLNEVSFERRKAELRAEQAERDLADLRGKLKAPNPDEYTDPAKLTADQINYTMDQREVRRLEGERVQASQEADKARALAWNERVQDFKADNPDFEQVAFNAPIGRETSLMVADMEDGPAVAYHLGKNPAEARRIEGLPERQRTFALGKIAAQITAPPPRRITNAPAPVNAASGKSGGGGTDDPAKMDMEEYARRRKSGWRG